MWLDDDGDDDPIAGPVPDPTERTWRHPSEVANGRNFGGDVNTPSPIPRQSPRNEPFIGSVATKPRTPWRPIPVIGSCLAVATIGLVALFLVGPTTEGNVVASGVNALDPTDPNETSPTTSTVERPVTTEVLIDTHRTSNPEAEDALTSQQQDRSITALQQGPLPTSAAAGDDSRSAATTATEDSPVGDNEALTAELNVSGEAIDTTAPPPDAIDPGMYSRSNGRARLGSFAVVDGLILTSAGAIGNTTDLSLWSGSDWVDATTIAIDHQADLAILETVDPSHLAMLPTVVPASSPIEAGVNANLDNPGPRAADGTGPDGLESYASPPGTEDADRAGTVIGLAATTTRAGSQLFGTLRTTIPAANGTAGHPLFDDNGMAIGLVVDGEGPNLAAVRMTWVTDYANTLLAIGEPSTAWLTAELVDSTEPGAEVVSVAAADPAATGENETLERFVPADRLFAIGEAPIRGVQHFYHLLRLQGSPGKRLTISVMRGGEPIKVPISIPPATANANR